VVAEGVETAGQFDLLRSLGCDLYQGFYLARPMPAQEIEKLLRVKTCALQAPANLVTA